MQIMKINSSEAFSTVNEPHLGFRQDETVFSIMAPHIIMYQEWDHLLTFIIHPPVYVYEFGHLLTYRNRL